LNPGIRSGRADADQRSSSAVIVRNLGQAFQDRCQDRRKLESRHRNDADAAAIRELERDAVVSGDRVLSIQRDGENRAVGGEVRDGEFLGAARFDADGLFGQGCGRHG
jgi:hypothetical protein